MKTLYSACGPLKEAADVHPDSFYKAYSSIDSACHSDTGTAGILGAEMSDCDSPITLVNATFQWVKDNLKDEIDFVIWTGDSARHDNDEDIPRTEKEIVDLNRMVVHKFVEVFGKDDNLDDPDPTNDFVVPIVPTFGNNDILPHNIFEPGPNRWTRDYADIWRKFIPEAQRHSFARGGWFFTEVIPNKLAIFSLNTMYFFDSNTAVDGCDSKSETGYEHMEWLRVQLQFMRERGMKAIMTGHVPPARTLGKQSWDETCWQKYSLWMRQYRDVVVSGIFGHMNIDHFMFQDAFGLMYNKRGQLQDLEARERNATDPMLSIQSKAEYLTDLRELWTSIPAPPSGMSYSELAIDTDDEHTLKKDTRRKKSQHDKEKQFLKDIGGKWAERFSLSLVSPSVVPNYFPTLRVVEYNITGMENEHPAMGRSQPAAVEIDVELTNNQEFAPLPVVSVLDVMEQPIQEAKHKKKNKKKKHQPRPPFKVPKPPSSTAAPGPAYSPQPFTLISYTQYFANLTFLNEEFKTSERTVEEYIGTSPSVNQRTRSRVTHPQKFTFETEYNTKTDKRYRLADLTVRSYLDLARRISWNIRTDTSEDRVLDILPDGRVVEAGGGEAGAEFGEEADHDDDLHSTRKRKRKKKHHKKKGKKGGKDKDKDRDRDALWHTFVKRAFVMTKTDEDMEDFDPGTYQRRSGR